MNKSILEDIKKELPRCRRDKLRIRSIYRKYRNTVRYHDWSDLILLNSIVIGLRELQLPYSIKEIYAAFQMISKNDYSVGQKKEILKSITKNTSNKSVFKFIKIDKK